MKTTSYVKVGLGRTVRTLLFAAATSCVLMTEPLHAQKTGIIAYTADSIVPASFTATLAVFQSNATGFYWYYNNQLIPGATNFAYNIFNVQSSNAGSYTVVISNALNTATTTPPMTLTVTNISAQVPSMQFATLASFNRFVDGSSLQAGVIQASDGYLYGTATTGGTNTTSATNGVVFKMSTNGVLSWAVPFNDINGQAPDAGLVQANDGNLYGTTSLGGLSGYGTLFRVTPDGSLTAIHNFDTGFPTNGASPEAALCLAQDGFLYGTTTTNGTGANGGTIFKISTNGGNLIWSVALSNATGCVPQAGLVQGFDGRLYGTAYQGGASNSGTVFCVTTNGVFSNLYSFTGLSDGSFPVGGLVQGPDGQLYGTTTYGGNATLQDGTFFKITTNGTLTTLADFDGTNGLSSEASLLFGGDGNLYGTANSGGVGENYFPSPDGLNAPAYGTVFQVTTNGALTTLISFGGQNGFAPHSALFRGQDGGLYGTTSEGGTNNTSIAKLQFGDGTLFRLGVTPPTIASAAVNQSTFSFSWNAMPGVPYQAQYKDALSQPQWMNLGASVVSANGVASQTDSIGATNKARFYRASLKF